MPALSYNVRMGSRSRMTRRQWTVLLGAAPLAATSMAGQAPAHALGNEPPDKQDDASKKPSARQRSTSEKLSKIEVPMDLEPAFSFKA
jgi:hypothetical protein